MNRKEKLKSKKNNVLIKKKKLIFIGIILIIILFISLLFLMVPKVHIELNGKRNVTVEVGGKYDDLGAKSYIESILGKQELETIVKSDVDTSKLGNYKIIYTAKYKNRTYETSRNVIVRDSTKPEISINGNIRVCKSSNLIEMNVKANDNYDGDISNKVSYKINDNEIEIFVSDSSGNNNNIKEKIKYIDNEKPIIKLNGANTISLKIGEAYEEYGAKASDSCDGDISNKIVITGQVDIYTPGTYEINYEVKDSNGNTSNSIRTINVIDEENDKNENIIYLTFDDGPGQYTEELLKVLNKYGVKATFFVTNQFPKFQYLIKKEFEEGHTIGIHTYSHKWNIYSSVDTYLDDFNNIENIVFAQTGIHPKFFRFPGGSSNTVSKKYAKGIMTELSKIMTEKGYTYFDWSFDSGDTSKNKNSKDDIVNTVKSHLNTKNNYIILMHDIKKNTLNALPEIIEYAKNKGYIFKGLDENVEPPHFKIAN